MTDLEDLDRRLKERQVELGLAPPSASPRGGCEETKAPMTEVAAVEKLRDYMDHLTNRQRVLTASQRLYICREYPEMLHADEINGAIEEFEMLHELIPALLAALEAR